MVTPGIIPAFAGNTDPSRHRSTRSRDHPRIRGEHSRLHLVLNRRPGSSPHSRGTPSRCQWMFSIPGIIPAFAGNTIMRWIRRNIGRDHPRIRGEHPEESSQEASGRGSSPHSRGTRVLRPWRDDRHGIIPAFAGNTRPVNAKITLTKDHPRIRGEHSTAALCSRCCPGSSPHSRGTHFRLDW